MHIYIPSLLDLPLTPTPIPPNQVTTEHRAELPVLYSRLPLGICFTHICTYVNPNLPVHPCPLPCTHMSVLTSASLFLPCKVHLYHFSRFPTYALILRPEISPEVHPRLPSLAPHPFTQLPAFHPSLSSLWQPPSTTSRPANPKYWPMSSVALLGLFQFNSKCQTMKGSPISESITLPALITPRK